MDKIRLDCIRLLLAGFVVLVVLSGCGAGNKADNSGKEELSEKSPVAQESDTKAEVQADTAEEKATETAVSEEETESAEEETEMPEKETETTEPSEEEPDKSDPDIDELFRKYLKNETKLDDGIFSDRYSYVKEDFDQEPESYLFVMDEDGKDELLVSTYMYGYDIYDIIDGELKLIDYGDGTADVCNVFRGEDHIYVSHSDFMHAGRNTMTLIRYDGDGKEVESISINAEYWDSPDDVYDENSDFTYNDKKISMQEFEEYRAKYELVQPEEMKKVDRSSI